MIASLLQRSAQNTRINGKGTREHPIAPRGQKETQKDATKNRLRTERDHPRTLKKKWNDSNNPTLCSNPHHEGEETEKDDFS